jgi:hypothetical protein
LLTAKSTSRWIKRSISGNGRSSPQRQKYLVKVVGHVWPVIVVLSHGLIAAAAAAKAAEHSHE